MASRRRLSAKVIWEYDQVTTILAYPINKERILSLNNNFLSNDFLWIIYNYLLVGYPEPSI